jgi:hypothetical protein
MVFSAVMVDQLMDSKPLYVLPALDLKRDGATVNYTQIRRAIGRSQIIIELRKEKKMIKNFFWLSVFVALFTFVIGMEGKVQAADEWFVLGEKTIKAVDQGVEIESEGGMLKRRVKKVKLSVEQADVEITKLVLNYGGLRRDDEITNIGVVKAGGQITPIDAPGLKAKLKSASVTYKILGDKETAVIKVWGFD